MQLCSINFGEPSCCIFYTAHLTFYGRYSAVFVFDPTPAHAKYNNIFWICLITYLLSLSIVTVKFSKIVPDSSESWYYIYLRTYACIIGNDSVNYMCYGETGLAFSSFIETKVWLFGQFNKIGIMGVILVLFKPRFLF